ncbi:MULTISPECIES: hypothetical protein [Sphingobacterium]|uniref:hypothetical protein n=1 Tax=Sphingobacterium TaxID=28453 RepID=UPI0013DAD40B|nr:MULTISPECIES: hypothetical protein [unclassified Sphingobacterium]
MGKIIIIGILLAVLIYFILCRLNFFNFGKVQEIPLSPGVTEIGIPTPLLKRGLKRVLYTVGTGMILLCIILLIAAKFKIALIMLPISLYLIGQFFVFNNHVKTIRNQKINYDSESQVIYIEWLDGSSIKFNLLTDIKKLSEVQAVQKNNGMLLGYYQIAIGTKMIFLPYLLLENPKNKLFFDKLKSLSRQSETKLFPII